MSARRSVSLRGDTYDRLFAYLGGQWSVSDFLEQRIAESSPFDLQLAQWEGNCDGCFKKKHAKALRWAHERPAAIGWWAIHEARTGQRFRKDRPGYARLRDQLFMLPIVDDLGDAEDCVCSD